MRAAVVCFVLRCCVFCVVLCENYFVNLFQPLFVLLIFCSSFIHTQKRNPKTHLKDPDMFWDFISLRPETTHQVPQHLFRVCYVCAPCAVGCFPSFKAHVGQGQRSRAVIHETGTDDADRRRFVVVVPVASRSLFVAGANRPGPMGSLPCLNTTDLRSSSKQIGYPVLVFCFLCLALHTYSIYVHAAVGFFGCLQQPCGCFFVVVC